MCIRDRDSPVAAAQPSGAITVESRDDLTLLEPTPIAIYGVDTDPADDTRVLARFSAPDPDCFAIQGNVDEDGPTGQILLSISGEYVEDPATCDENLVAQEVWLDLAAPRGTRDVSADLTDLEVPGGEPAFEDTTAAPFAEFTNLSLIHI